MSTDDTSVQKWCCLLQVEEERRQEEKLIPGLLSHISIIYCDELAILRTSDTDTDGLSEIQIEWYNSSVSNLSLIPQCL